MKKRGASHIDWVISIGVFIVYILVLLTWIKPGYEPVFEEGILIDIVKETIEDTYAVEVSKTLIIVDGCAAAGNKKTFTLSEYISGIGGGNFEVVKVSDGERAFYKGAATLGLYSISKNEYWIISSSDFNNYGINSGNLDDREEDPNCFVSKGEPIVKKGLRTLDLQALGNALRAKGFPDSKEVKILLRELPGGEPVCFSKSGGVNCDSFQPESNVAVNSFEWRYNLLDKDYSYSPLMITILIW